MRTGTETESLQKLALVAMGFEMYVAVLFPGLTYRCEAESPLALVPSPKRQRNDIEPVDELMKRIVFGLQAGVSGVYRARG